MTHCTTAGTPVGVSDSLLRLSIGLEDCDELIADLAQALARESNVKHLIGQHGAAKPSSGLSRRPLRHRQWLSEVFRRGHPTGADCCLDAEIVSAHTAEHPLQ